MCPRPDTRLIYPCTTQGYEALASPKSRIALSDDSLTKILVVDDESSLRRVLSTTLTAMGFSVSAEPSGERAIERLQAEAFDAVLLDLNMPGMGGIGACRLMRRRYPQLGILILTVRQGQEDKVEALEAGADDYILKPFELSELAARIRAVVRRAHRCDESERLQNGELELNRRNRSLTKSGQPVHLTPNEFALLQCLMSRAGELVPYTEVFRAVWGQEGIQDHGRLRSLVRQLRKKIEHHPEEPTFLRTEPGFGCRFRATGNNP
jgi:two-component system, OmpR family, KDP operon response regulator KdpE